MREFRKCKCAYGKWEGGTLECWKKHHDEMECRLHTAGDKKKGGNWHPGHKKKGKKNPRFRYCL